MLLGPRCHRLKVPSIVSFLVICFAVLTAAESDASALKALIDGVDLQLAVDTFHKWFAEGYGKECPVELGVARDGMRLGVFAKKKIPAESLYLSIPMHMIISDGTIFSTPRVGNAIQRLLGRLNGQLQPKQVSLSLFLIHERFIAQNRSFFFPYIQLIPSEHDIPEHFTEDELRLLRGTLIPAKVRNERARHRDDYILLRSLIQADKHMQSILPLHTFTLEHYIWTQGILNTRMIWWDGEPHLVPMLDMINCRQGPNPHRVHSTRRGSSNRADTLAPWTFEKGDQVFENYGQPNPTYFLWHGFVMEPNFHDCAQLNFVQAMSSHASPEKRKALERFQLHRRTEFCLKAKGYRSLAELLSATRILVATDKELALMKSAPQGKVSRVNEGKALSLVKKHITATLHDMATIDEIDKTFANKELPFRARMIRQYVFTQRQLMESLVNDLEEQIAPLRRKKTLQRTSISESGEL